MPAPLPAPVEAFEASLSPAEREMIEVIGQCSAVGSLQTVQAKLDGFLSQTGADELMLVSSIFDPEQRLESYELGAVAMENLSQAAQPHRAAG